MRAGDFSEVAAAYPRFQLYNPRTGGAGGMGRIAVPELPDPGEPDQPELAGGDADYPVPNTTPGPERQRPPGRLRDHAQPVPAPRQLRHQADLPAHALALDLGQVRDARRRRYVDNFILGFDKGSLGDTRIYVGTIGHTWTLSPTPGARRQLRRRAAEPDSDRPRLRHEPRPRPRDPGRERQHGALQRPAHLRRRARSPTATRSAARRTGCRSSATSAATRSPPT